MSQKPKIGEHVKATKFDKFKRIFNSSTVSKTNTTEKNNMAEKTIIANTVDKSSTAENTTTEDNRATQNGTFEDRMQSFVTTYVKEFEARLFFYDLIHRGQIEEAKKFKSSDTEKVMGDVGKYGSFASGFIASLAFAAAPLSLPAAATASAMGFRGISAGETGGKWIGEKTNSTLQDKKRKDYANKFWYLIKLFNKDRVSLRKILISAALDVFRSFEQQFVKVNNDEKWRRGMIELATDAVHRSINYSVKHYKPTKKECDEDEEIKSISKGVIEGESKKRLRPDLAYEDDNGTIKWKSSDLYEKAGIAVENGGKYSYYEQNDSSDKANNYGYRLLLHSEDWAKIKEKYKLSKEKENRFQSYKYKFKTLKDSEKKQISYKVDSDNDLLTKGGLKEVIEEVKQSIISEIIESLKSQDNETKEYFTVLQKITNNIEKIDVQELEKKYVEHLNEIKTTLQDFRLKQEECHNENKSLHQKTHETLQEIRQKTQETHVIVQSIYDGKQLENNQQILFDIILPINTYTRKSELNVLNETMQRNLEQNITKSVIWGLGGIGKTQLARQYIEQIGRKIYENIIWINSETEADIIDSFIRLAKKFNLKIPNADKDKMKIILNQVYEILSKRDTLFVFDNAEKSQSFIEMLPKTIYSYEKKPHILITSRNREWGKNFSDVHLQELSLEDGMQLVKERLNIMDDSENERIVRLLDKLQNFPLCVNQAVSYICEKNLSGKFTIRKYLNEFENIPKDLFDSNSFKVVDNDPYAKTAYTTWLITIKKIKSESSIGDLAIKIFNIMSYLAPQDIKRSIFQIVSNNNMDLEKATRLLAKYSMIDIVETNDETDELEGDGFREEGNSDETCIQVHRMVQYVTRLHVKENNAEDEVIKNTFKVLQKYVVVIEQTLTNYEKVREGLPHIETFFKHIKFRLTRQYHAKKDMEMYDYLSEFHASSYFHLRNPTMLKDLSKELLMMYQKYYGPDDYRVAITLSNLGNAYGSIGDVQKKKELLETALNIQEKHYGPDHYEVAVTLVNLGNSYGSIGDIQKKKELLERALNIQEKHYGPDHYEVAITLANLGNAYGSLGDVQKRKKLLERALNIQEKHYGPDHYEVAITLLNLGNAYGSLGDVQKQKELLEKRLNIQEKQYGPDHYEVARTLGNLGNAYGSLGDVGKKKELLEKALNIQEKHYGTDHYEVAKTLANLGNSYGSIGDIQKKKELLERALNIQEKHYGRDHYEVAITLANLGNAYGSIGDVQKKKELLERALNIQEKHYGPDHYLVAIILRNLGSAYGSIGDVQKQKELSEKAVNILIGAEGDHKYVFQKLIKAGAI